MTIKKHIQIRIADLKDQRDKTDDVFNCALLTAQIQELKELLIYLYFKIDKEGLNDNK